MNTYVLAFLVFLANSSIAVCADTKGGAPDEFPITADQRAHWSYRPLKRPAVPQARNITWPRNPIDRFLLHRIEKNSLQPAPQADRVTLIRRVTFDLTGLPPTPAEIDAFVHDRSPNAYEKLVDRLLASPAYGEHQAQAWLDLARFAETDGFEHDLVRRGAWRYRDWVIAAVNADVPYNEFVQLQLAADQLRPDDADAQNALGFLLCGSDMPDINLQAERRHSFLNDMTGTVGSVFLGLQFACAQCHDHKYDPISQADFYRLRAFFDPYFEFKRNKHARLVGPKGTETVSHLMVRGDFRRNGAVVQPRFLRVVAPAAKPVTRLDRRRAELAKWLTRADHPLATRVIVNRLWQSHFGKGLSATPSDFGVMGDEPIHRQLLDWLATELPRRGWSLKAMHRLMVTSATYRQASRLRTDDVKNAQAWKTALKKDPSNQLWARMSRQRLTGEEIRDAMLAAADGLSQRRGGPGVRPPLPKEMLITLLKRQWPLSPDERDHRRRSVYLFVRRNLRFPIFRVFDKPDLNLSCPRRNRSTTAPQSLLLLNSRFSLDAARRLSRFVREHSGVDRTKQIATAVRLTLGRWPTPRESRALRQFLHTAESRLRKEGRDAADALTDLCLVLFNLNEFIYVD
jgi:Protein of unknown function (DUF1553)/Protein of unknown function (DUF1549)